jgi:hypothetical protein
MASQMRYRKGVVAYVALQTHASHPIEAGDLVYESAGVAYPATSLADAGTAAQNRAAFAGAFAGVASLKTGLQSGEFSFKLTTAPGWTLVAVSGVWEYPCAATSWSPGDLVGVYADADGCYDQQVAQVTGVDEAIGVAEVPYNALGDSQTAILVHLRSQLMHSSVSGQ